MMRAIVESDNTDQQQRVADHAMNQLEAFRDAIRVATMLFGDAPFRQVPRQVWRMSRRVADALRVHVGYVDTLDLRASFAEDLGFLFACCGALLLMHVASHRVD